MKKIFVLAGRKATGKTTAMNYIRETAFRKSLTVNYISFARPLKEACMTLFGLTHLQCYGEDSHKNTLTKWDWTHVDDKMRAKFNNPSGAMTARQILQVVGTNLFRESFMKNFWVEVAVRSVKESESDIVIIDDARFPNEVDSMNELGAVVIKMTRNKIPKDNHLSESALDDYPDDCINYVVGPDIEGVPAVEQAIHDILIEEGLHEH